MALRDPLEPLLQPDLTPLLRLSPERAAEISKRIGHDFADRSLLALALTHASTQKHKGDYQRLEFLGDRVLGLCIADHLFRHNPDKSEGELSATLSALVRREACALAADRLNLSDLVITGESERAKGMHLNRTVLGDVMEALIGAIYIDGGLEAARGFVLKNWAEQIAQPAIATKDAKTFLQEWALARSLPLPAYRVISRDGPEHEPVFVVEVEVKGKAPARGSAKAKRAAEQEAAEDFITREGLRS